MLDRFHTRGPQTYESRSYHNVVTSSNLGIVSRNCPCAGYLKFSIIHRSPRMLTLVL